ncbi:MAG: D-alanine--D-alanine ligase [bacterium]
MKIQVGVLRGGPSHEYDVSIKTGAAVIKNIPKERFDVVDIFLDKNGEWHVAGLPISPDLALKRLDVVFNALHGQYGEDGKVQRFLEAHGIPFTGSGSHSSAVGMNKALSKKAYKKNGIKTPYHILIEKDGDARSVEERAFHIFRSFPMPAVVKPVSSGSSVGVFLALDFQSFIKAIDEAFKISDDIMIEEYIKGKEATCAVVEGFRNESLYALPPIEIRPHNGALFDYSAKYEGKSDEICPGNFTEEERGEIMRLAREAHEALNLSHYSRTDFMIHPRRGIYVLETNTLPGLTNESLLPKSLAVVGASLSSFIEHLLDLALKSKKG